MTDRGETTRSVHFGKALKYFRRREGLTQTELANRVNVGQTTIVAWEKQGYAIDDPFMLTELARVLNAPVEYLEEGRIPNPTPQEEQDAMLDYMKRVAAFYGGPNADWTELRDTVTAIYAIKDPVKRRQEIAYLMGLAARQGQPPNTMNEPGAAYTTNEHDAL